MDLQQRFDRLREALIAGEPFWRSPPFVDPYPVWLTRFPELATALMALSDSELEHLEQDDERRIHWLAPYLPALSSLLPLIKVPRGVTELDFIPNPRQFAHIPGRKWSQIQAFCANLEHHEGTYLEWCAGKGHLGRLTSHRFQQPVCSLEYDGALCEEGARLAQRNGTAQRFVCQDVMAPSVANQLPGVGTAMALHACGDLHGQLLQLGVAERIPNLLVSPCCYHLTAQPHYQHFSAHAKRRGLALSKSELRLAVEETATAPAKVRRLRRIEVSYRLGLKALYQDQKGEVASLQVPSCAKSILGEGFAAFCQWADAQRGLSLTAPIDWNHYQSLGEMAWQRQIRLELLRHTFRRPLELYLVLDRALYLKEQGYEVSVLTFAERDTTPRNLLIRAVRR
ncbi:methyltransferase [Ferrimonas gelatinilytica]|uniref:Methyltransferase n=1 Tax=Ferrimonas gelatinilytica TaxID=1255257 RepID=A0ABP9RXN2_9GAMM